MPQTTDPQDILIVQNIDLNCDEQDEEYGYNHRDGFTVRWDGHPHRIEPGKTRRMPRYIAEHYAKHLTDHIIMKMQDASGGKKNLMNDKKIRGEIMNKIILGVDEFFLADTIDPGTAAAKQVEELNKDKPVDIGEYTPVESDVPNAAKPIAKQAVEIEPVDEEPAKPITKAKRTRSELILECETLGLETTGRETVDELEAKIAKF